jgi:hypothetical protein
MRHKRHYAEFGFMPHSRFEWAEGTVIAGPAQVLPDLFAA